MNNLPVIVAESFDIYRQGVESVLQAAEGIRWIKSCTSGKELISQYKKNPDAVCLVSSGISDYNIHDLMLELKKISEKASVIVLTHSTEITHLNQSLKAGVKGYLAKNIPATELISAVREVGNGNQAFGKSASQLMIGRYTDLAKRTPTASKKLITKREREILNLIVEGYTSAEIAKLLFISTRTVETHRSNLMSKLDLKNTAALVRYAMEQDLS